MTQPIDIPNQLAPTPNKDPHYFVKIKGPEGEVTLADPRATRALVALMDMNAVMGGAASHYGGPAAFAELMSALHGYVFAESRRANKPWHEMFHLINDGGHCENGLYALKANYHFAGLTLNDLKKFRSIESPLTGHGESHLFPEAVYLSNGPLGSAFPQSQGLAMADALAGRARVTITAITDGACMEGEAREAFAAIPGFAKKNQLAPFILIISDNNTKLSGRIDQESFSMTPTFQSLSTLGWKVLTLENGNDLTSSYLTVAEAIRLARGNPSQPVAIHAKTIKGIGTKKTAESSSGGHGFPLKKPEELRAFLSEIYNGEPIPPEFTNWIEELIQKKNSSPVPTTSPSEKIQVGIASAMLKCKQAGLPIVSITSDLPGSTGVAEFRKKYPAESFDVGVAESNMISAAAGFSKAGFIPVVDTFAQFGVTKGALPLIMSSLSQAPMVCIFSHTGFQDAADGASHQALNYLSMVGGIPHVDVYCLANSTEAESLLMQTFKKFEQDRKEGRTPHTSIFFLGRENFPREYAPSISYVLGRAQVLLDNTGQFPQSVCLVASGSMVPETLTASSALSQKNIGAIVINPSIHNRPDTPTISAAVKKCNGRIVVCEDHQLIGGFAQTLSFALSQASVQFKMKALAVHGSFGQSAYNAIDLYQLHRLDSESMVLAASSLIE